MRLNEEKAFMKMGIVKSLRRIDQERLLLKNIFFSRGQEAVRFCSLDLAYMTRKFLSSVNRSFVALILCCVTIGFSVSSLKAQESGSLLMDMERRIGGLEETVHELTGKVEELQHALKMAQQGTLPAASETPSLPSPDKALTAQDMATGKGVPDNLPFAKARGSDSGVVSSEPLSEEGGKDSSKPETEQEAYDKARRLLNQGDYEKSEAAFKSFISSFDKSPLVVNAQYWLGETYYLRQDYERSSVAFMDAYKTYRAQVKDGGKANSFAKAPESLIKLVSSLKGLGKNQNACVTYKQLRKEFPKLPSNLERLAQKSVEGLPCQ